MEHQQNALLRKRSSLKRKSTLKDANLEAHFQFNNDQSFKRKITWNIEEGETNTDGESALNKSNSDRSYSSAKTHYSDIDEKDDLYLKKLQEINSIEPTKELIDEIIELTENNEEADPEKGSSDSTPVSSGPQSPELAFKRNRSLKDEFELMKAAVQKNEEELSTEVIAETMKNTLYNRVIGKLADETD